MKSLKYAIAFICVLALGAAPGPGVSEPMELQEILGLSDAQVQQLRDINAALAEAVQPEREQIRTLQSQLRAEFASETPNPSVIGQIEVDIQGLMARMAATRSDFAAQARAALTAEQAAMLVSLEQALALAVPARQAVALNLIDAGGASGFGGSHRGPRGLRARGPR